MYPEDCKGGLTNVCLQHLGGNIDKSERMSNWERRPLRLAQMHYGALDAYCLISLVNKLIPLAEKAGIDLKKIIKPEDLNKPKDEDETKPTRPKKNGKKNPPKQENDGVTPPGFKWAPKKG
jgi:hypothetical protein